MEIKDFDPVLTELRKGTSLIEASAGTGKTYTIAMLVLRLLVEQDVSIDKVLVVTFTKAATEELKDRIRNRLADAKRVLAGHTDTTDSNIGTWLAQIDLPPEIIKRRLDLALLDIDQAGIFTIHGFCQRVLREHALASGQLFDAELTDDLAAIKQACADDFWRRHVQNRTAWEVAVLTKDIKSPDALLGSINNVSNDALIYPDELPLDTALAELKQLADNAKTKLAICAQKVEAQFTGQSFKASYQAIFTGHCSMLGEWLQGDTLQFPNAEALSLLTYEGLLDGLNGTQFKKNKDRHSEERKAEFLASLNLDTKPFEDLAAKAEQITVALRRSLLEFLRKELDKQLEQINVWSFDNLITHLAIALDGERSQQLIGELRQRFNAALIDEFQDTDNNQWHIFSSIFAVDSHYLVLVGDPKQAIYKFRGADIYSYLEAQTQAQHRFTLRNNWRSHPLLVEAVNRLFQREQAFLLPDIVFNTTQPGLSKEDGTLHACGKAAAPMMLWQLQESDSKTGYWQSNHSDAADAICIAVVDEIVELLTGNYTIQPQNRKLQPQDIAILVQTNKQAREYQQALRQAGVPSILNSTESVFTSAEAEHLYILLQAVAHPGDINLLGLALALSWFGHDGQRLYQIINSEIEMDNILSRFLGYYQTWQQAGMMTMMQTLLKQEKISAVLSKSVLAERRLTNLQHILELLQQAVIDERLGIHKTLNWLKTAITRAKENPGSPDSQQLRLESDADAVKIITMHRAKGLEYPIVFCPYLWQRKHRPNEKNPLVLCHLPEMEGGNKSRLIVDLGSAEIDKHHAQAQYEDHAEDLRLAYVAVTRAKCRCYIAWANVRAETAANDSALAWLLDFAEDDFSGQQAVLQALQTQDENTFAYRLLDSSGTITGSYQPSGTHPKLLAKKRHRSLYTDWQMSSYTALSALSLSETPEMPEDKVGENQYTPNNLIDTRESLVDLLPAGAHTGNVIHELLEHVPFIDLANKRNISALRDKTCQRYGLRLEQPEIIDNLLHKTVTTPLSVTDPQFCLMNIPDAQCLKEIPFYLSLPSFNTHQLNGILHNKPAFQPLTAKQMSGFLTGFIDLICVYGHRYYVMDYKTNSLPDYRIDTLTHAMREHNYGLQYWIYSAVLHSYLQNRLANYNYAQHFGGVRYLFVRGMGPDTAMSGVFQDSPDLPTIEALTALFKERTC
ncbi:exodeoxyribonuclease V subunit beta [Methyloglobulus sp.]|uniref:exodeoxyribonuclease V subunit beta n=1 Tax=Methyloglobulus sp. TaxID=2518622 RepID=UPI0039894CF7